jgi:hypothetical protein
VDASSAALFEIVQSSQREYLEFCSKKFSDTEGPIEIPESLLEVPNGSRIYIEEITIDGKTYMTGVQGGAGGSQEVSFSEPGEGNVVAVVYEPSLTPPPLSAITSTKPPPPALLDLQLNSTFTAQELALLRKPLEQGKDQLILVYVYFLGFKEVLH